MKFFESLRAAVLLLFIIEKISCVDFEYFGVQQSDIKFIDLIQSSVVNEKFPKLQILSAGNGITDDQKKIIVTNLGNLNNTIFTSKFKTQKTVFFVYGWRDVALKSDQSGQILDSAAAMTYSAYAQREYFGEPVNILALNWVAYNQGDYFSTITNLQPIANEVGDQLYKMAFESSDPVNLSTWHIVGFSLGAHIAGLIARRVKERSNGNFMMPRATALDPAGPFLNYPITSLIFPHIEKTDAKFIDVVHTNANGFGSGWKIGHIDFWPNYGNNQPGCPGNNGLDFLFRGSNICSHLRAVIYYAFSVTNSGSNPFPAVRCVKNIFNHLQCTNDETEMGFGASSTAPEGDYYLLTDSERPYYRGESGIAPFIDQTGGGTYNFQ